MQAQALPYDVIHTIVSHLKACLSTDACFTPRLASYAGIDKSWNRAIERHTFACLGLTKDKLERAGELLKKDPSRISALRSVGFCGYYYQSASLRKELSETQLRERDEAFSTDMQALFRFLAGMKRDAQAGLDLELDIASEEIQPDGWAGDDEEDDSDSDFSDGPFMVERPRYDPEHLRYTGPGLPRVNCVRRFDVPVGSSNDMLWGPSIASLVAAMYGLERCHLFLHDVQARDARVWTRYRKALGESLAQLHTTCTDFSVESVYILDDEESPPSSGLMPFSLDSLSIGLRDLSTRLTVLWLELIFISPSLFWPGNEEKHVAEPVWPKMEYIYIRSPAMEASGERFLYDDPEPEINYAALNRL